MKNVWLFLLPPMKESQNIEWKESWHDEFIKWICGFANAIGGKLFIGINDKGIVTGISNANKLLEDIPNKVRDILGIIVDVELKSENGKDFLEISVPAYPNPVKAGRWKICCINILQNLLIQILPLLFLGLV